MERMTPDEIRWRHKERGVSVSILAELNACDQSVIRKILQNKDYKWSDLNSRKGAVVVNATEGRFYPSIRAAERGEGYSEGLLAHRFRNNGPRITCRGQEYHLYRGEA